MESRWQRAPWRKEPFKIQWKEQNGPAKMGEARRRSMQSIRNFNYSSSSGRIASPTSYCSYLLTLKLMLTWLTLKSTCKVNYLYGRVGRRLGAGRWLSRAATAVSQCPVGNSPAVRPSIVFFFFPSPPLLLFRSVYSDEHYNNYQLMIKCI